MAIQEDFHLHLYFDGATRDSALAIRERLRGVREFEYELPPVRETPIGPHYWPLWSIWVDRANFTAALEWMMRNHGQHSVLIHPETGEASGKKDHTDHAMWLGAQRALNLDAFDGPE